MMTRETGWSFSGRILPRMNSVTQRRRERDREQRREQHDEGLGVGERLEQPPRLAVQREDRQERHRDDQQREEDRRASTSLRRLVEQLVPIGARAARARASCARLDHHDLGVDRGADRDRDAAEAHDRRRDVEQHHRDERERDATGSDRIGSSELRRWSRNRMITRLTTIASSISACLQRVDRALDQARAVVGDRRSRRPRGSSGSSSASFCLHALDDVERVLAVAHDHDAADRLALAVPLEQRRAGCRGRSAPSPTSSTRTGVPLRPLGAERDLLDRRRGP